MSRRFRSRCTYGAAALVFTLALLVAFSEPAWACSLEQRPQPLRVVPGALNGDVPRNVIFSPPASRGGLDAENYFWAIDDAPVDLQVDARLTDLMTFEPPFANLSTTVYRPIEPLRVGDAIAACYRNTCGEERSTVTETVDETAPTKPVIEDIEVTIYDSPSKGPGTFCPELDFIQIEVSASDDTTPLELNRVLIFTGETREAVADREQPTAAMGGELADDGTRLRIESWLGLDSVRGNDYSPLSSSAEVCFSLAMMDWAGNVSERTAAECIDTTDRTGRYANVVEGAGCGCSSASPNSRSVGPLLLALVGLLVLRTQRRRW